MISFCAPAYFCHNDRLVTGARHVCVEIVVKREGWHIECSPADQSPLREDVRYQDRVRWQPLEKLAMTRSVIAKMFVSIGMVPDVQYVGSSPIRR